jgi:hypothetical protein
VCAIWRPSCKFCQARLVGAGVLDPQAEVSAYAADYGMRNTEAELAAIASEASTTA